MRAEPRIPTHVEMVRMLIARAHAELASARDQEGAQHAG
jgi:hypothetical protein